MNTTLKTLMSLLFDSYDLVKDVEAKKNIFQIIPDGMAALSDLRKVISGMSTFQTEVAALKGTQEEIDLVSFIETKFSLETPSDKAQKILAASLNLIVNVVQDAIALEAAIKG